MDLEELPLPLALHLAERLSADPEQVRRLTGGAVILDHAQQFARQLGRLFGPGPPGYSPARVIQERVAFLLTAPLLERALSGVDPAPGALLATRTTVCGREHLEASVARGRGTVLVSTHFGFPILVRLVLQTLTVPVIVATARRSGGRLVSLEGDRWASVRALRRVRTSLDANAVSVFAVDGMTGSARVAVPFFRRKAHIGLGAFHLARQAGCPVVPFFAVAPHATGHFELTFLPALNLPAGAQDQALTGAVLAFVDAYRPYAARYPSHLPYRALFQN